ncbi:MAG: LysR family transcriptional regulator [Deltaproteobacteria bacterium]|nr:LysR family transcriptional regulator [Deltaproteobacteria bacterium]
MEVKFKVWLEKDGEVLMGHGKVGLLKKIGDLGSIQKAAEKSGMSYRHAWGMIRKIEKRAGFKFVETQVGGREGGSAKLTPQGNQFLRQFSSFCQGLDDFIEKKFRSAFQR